MGYNPALTSRASRSNDQAIDLWLHKVRGTQADVYRKIVWDCFKRIVANTPQWSGKAVANWEIGIDAVSAFVDQNLGDEDLDEENAHVKGFFGSGNKWAHVALRRNRPKMDLVKWNTKVYFSNRVMGDAGGPASSGDNFAYLEALQDPAYWSTWLREVNRPYETAQQSVVITVTAARMMGYKTAIGGTSLDMDI